MSAKLKKLTHFDRSGKAQMVDIGPKKETHRVAQASGRIVMEPKTLRMISAGTAKKGDVLGIARVAAIQAAKRTAELIPLAHPIVTTRVSIAFDIDSKRASIECTAVAETFDRTGVEMEALTSVAIGLLTIYDMCKAVDRGMRIENIRLLQKSGGASGEWSRKVRN